MDSSPEIQCITERAHAAEVLQPLRLEILRLTRDPTSASEMSQKLGLSRQRVNYHVRVLARSGFLKRAGRRRRRNMVEQRYVASARAFLLSPELLGAVGADWRKVEDATSAGFLLALSCQMGSDLVRVWRESGTIGKQVSTLSLKSQFRFESPEQRERFTKALEEAVVRVVTDHTSPNLKPDGSPGPGSAYRLVLGCYPYLPRETAGAPARG
ncbi:MAG TPA: helix-turn-helix domain-containing protein [Thermoanaerobaculia bacterium]|nr:helix-turn-helix domain-containing protein [Thermoanaerobaculia bacterium]